MSLAAGARLGPYEIVSALGAGGMGEVYRARDEHLGRDVALKVLPAGTLADDSARRRFRAEAEALARLNHPHIATVHDFATQDGADFLVMEFVPGSSLADRLAEGSLPEKEALRLAMQVAARYPGARPVDGGSPDGTHREPGWAIPASLEEARRLAGEFLQNAVFWFDGERFSVVPVHSPGEPLALPVR